MDERELRQRLTDTANTYRFGFEGSERVVRRTRTRILRIQALAAVAVAGGIFAVVTLVTGDESRLVPQPQPPIGPGPTESGLDTTEVDYMIDLKTHKMTPLPEAILKSLGPDDRLRDWVSAEESGQYAASPDGSLLAYVGTDAERRHQIFIAGIDGTGVRQVTHDSKEARSPAWSPDGTMIVYEGFGSQEFRNLFVLDVATGESTRITDEPPTCRGCSRNPQFTPDGSSIIYTGGSDEYPVVRTVPVAGGKSTILIGPGEGLKDAGNASMSPDGSLVTFLGSEGEGGPIRFVSNVDGADRRMIPGWVSNPAGTWSRDGTRIVCLSSAEQRVIIVDVATGDTFSVAEGRGAIWLDHRTLIVEA